MFPEMSEEDGEMVDYSIRSLQFRGRTWESIWDDIIDTRNRTQDKSPLRSAVSLVKQCIAQSG